MKNARYVTVSLAIVAVVLLIGCSRADTRQDGTAKLTRIGAVLPMTGPAGWLGEQELIGLEAAAETYSSDNRVGRIEIKVEDTASQSAKAATVAQRLIDIDRVDALFVTTSSAFKAVVPLAERANKPVLVMASEPDLVRDHPTSFRIYMNFSDESSTFARYIRQAKARRVAIVRLNIESFGGSVASLRQELGAGADVLIAEEAYEISTRDFRAIVEKIAALSPDLVLILPLGGEFPTLMEQLRQQPALARLPVLAGYAVTGPPGREKGLGIFEGVTFTVFPVTRNTPAVHSIFSSRRTRSGLELSDFTDYAYAYDSVSLLAEAIRSRGSEQSLLDAMRGVSRIDGITGLHEVHDRQIRVPLQLARYENGVVTVLP